MDNQNNKLDVQKRLAFTIAGNMGNQIGQLHLQLAQYQVAHEKDQQKIQQLKESIADLQGQNPNLTNQLKKLKEENAELKTQLKSLRNNKSRNNQNTIAELNHQIDGLKKRRVNND